MFEWAIYKKTGILFDGVQSTWLRQVDTSEIVTGALQPMKVIFAIERYELDQSMILETSYRNFKNVHNYMYVIYDYHEHNYTNFNILMLAIL